MRDYISEALATRKALAVTGLAIIDRYTRETAMPVDDCTSTFADLAAVVMPGYMAQLRKAMAAQEKRQGR